MKRKSLLVGCFLIMMMLIFGAGMPISNAAEICAQCGSSNATVKYRSTGNTYHEEYIDCRACGYQLVIGTLRHSTYDCDDLGDGANHRVECKCGYIIASSEPHSYSAWTPISITQCQAICTRAGCGYIKVENHTFSNGKCTKCGLTQGTSTAMTTSANPEYFVVKNVESSDLIVNITVKGVNTSTNGSYRTLVFTDTIPGKTTRIYVKGFSSETIMGKGVYLGYYDVGTGAKAPLALVSDYNSDSSSNGRVSTSDYITVSIPTNPTSSSTAWTTASGTATTFYLVTTANNIYHAVRTRQTDYFYRGVRGAENTQAVTASSVAGVLANGSVIIEYEDNHKCTFNTTYTSTATTHTATSKCTNSNCGKVITGSAESHTWNLEHICIVCGYQGQHSGGTATCTSPGVCSVCGGEYIAALGHDISTSTTSYANYNNTQHYHLCSRGCGYAVGYANHEYTETVVTAATCTTTGTVRYDCKYCDYTYNGTIEKAAHSWGNYIANGSSGHRRQCSVCRTWDTTVAHTYSNQLELSVTNPTTSHAYICSVCNYEKDKQTHTMTATPLGQSGGVYVHKLNCNVCNKYTIDSENCTFTSTVIKNSTCTELGTRRYTCQVCAQTYDENIAMISHVWSDWQTNKNEHWKICNYGCGTENSRGAHVDSNPRDAYCDTCNYLMYIIPVATISNNVQVKEGETATFVASVSEGSQPLSYQWYYKQSANGAGNILTGETSSSITITTTKEMNGRYYYCVVSNPGGSDTTDSALLTVYYTFTIGTQPRSVSLKKDETATFSVAVGEAGNPNTYTYQWYVANSATGAGSKITGATSSSYSVTPTKNITGEYYYCIISNGQYNVTSDRAKLVADITLPEVNIGSFNENITINNTATLNIPFTVTDTGEGYTENNTNFTATDIIVKVDGAPISGVSKSMAYNGASGNVYNYTLTISNITGDGNLSFEIPAGSVEDNLGNKNLGKTFDTNVTVDNTAPKITLDSLVSGVNDKYANDEDTIVIKVIITEAEGMNSNEFTAEDIIINVGGDEDTNADVKVAYDKLEGDDYYYTVTIENVTGNGELSIEVPADSVKDIADNSNEETKIIVTNNNGEAIIIDNIVPDISSLVAKLESYTSSREYPTSLDPRHNNWAKENIYVQINATDDQEIGYYSKSTNGTNFTELSSNQEVISQSINTTVKYRVYDKAGNYSEISKEIKLDKITPAKPTISMFEQRLNGAEYVFDSDEPTNKSVYVIPDISTIIDAGEVKSGIELDKTYTYYTLHRYKDLDKNVSVGTEETYAYDEHVVLKDTGYYEIQMTMTDIAGNEIKSDVFKVYINKGAENTIRITNINDLGSGISQAVIRVYICDEAGNKTSEEAIPQIVVDDPYKEIVKNVKLSAGTYYIEVTLFDYVGNTKVLTKTITNTI